ncbi:hypothetical protein, partial [Methylobacterium mesophilicum]|uniref:hypothetical protein n=1 Tax=Methylobacterium mesophilicum TaxID=39956 RepID=UPI001EE305B9
GAWRYAHRAGRAWGTPVVRRSLLAGASLMVVASSVAVLVAAGQSDGGRTSPFDTQQPRSGAPSASTDHPAPNTPP